MAPDRPSVLHQLPFSLDLLDAAIVLCKVAVEVEKASSESVGSRDRHRDPVGIERQQANSTAAIVLAAAALEAAANEFFSSATHGIRPHGLARERLSRLWSETRLEREPVLNKYAAALLVCDAPALERGSRVFQRADLLIKFRNALLHFESTLQPSGEWIQDANSLNKLQKRLREQFHPNPIPASGHLLWPHMFLCSHAAAWAIVSAYEFMDEFEKRLGRCAPTYLHDDIDTLRKQIKPPRTLPHHEA